MRFSKTKSTNDRYEQILNILPEHKWSIPEAAKAVGYDENYAERRITGVLKKNVAFCCALEEKKAEIKLKADIEIDSIVQSLREIAESKDKGGIDYLYKPSERLKALELLGRYKAMFADRQIIDSSDERKNLDEVQRQEARRLSIIALNDKYKQDVKAG
jgi:hypothetical protein